MQRRAKIGRVLLIVVLAARTGRAATTAPSLSAQGIVADTTTPCGESWAWANPLPQGNSLSGVTWAGTQFVAVGTDVGPGTVLTSPDGFVWTSRNPGAGLELTGAAWTGSLIVVVGSRSDSSGSQRSAILTSSDGKAWTPRAAATLPYRLHGVTWTGSQLVAVGEMGTVLTSPNGITWTAPSLGTFAPLSAAASTGTRLVVVGAFGTIMTSECSPGCSPPSITWPFYLEARIQGGQEATMSVSASGTSPLSYQWYEGSSGDTSTPVGSDSSVFSTPPLTTTTRYWVHVGNACGHIDSPTVTVTVEHKIRRRLRHL